MGKEGTGPYPRGALPEQESDPGNEFYDLSATIVDPQAGLRAAAAIAAARGFGQHEVPTKESKNVAAALAAHERNLADERRVSTQPTPSAGFDLRVDALQESEPPTGVRSRPVENPGAFETEVQDQFDIPVHTGSAPSPLPRPRSNGLVLMAIALIAGVGGFAAFRFGAAKLASAKRPPAAVAPTR